MLAHILKATVCSKCMKENIEIIVFDFFNSESSLELNASPEYVLNQKTLPAPFKKNCATCNSVTLTIRLQSSWC